MGRGLSSVVAALALTTASLVFGEMPEGLKEPLDAIVKGQEKARQRFSKGLEGKTTAEAQKPVVDIYLAETDRNTRKVLDLVRANPNDPSVVEALQFVINTARAGPGNESYRALEILKDHVRAPGMGGLCGSIFYFVHAPAAESLLRSVLQQHPNRDDRGQACYTLARYLVLQARMVRRIREKPARIDEYVHARHREGTERFVKAADPEALEKEAERLLERVVAEFADVKDWYDKRPLGELAEGELFEARNLSVGKVAPEITGKDHEGKPFALSETRGRVVVLTFSGNWCGPCVGMYPQERELVRKLKDKPFALVSVNTDEDVETLKKSIATGEITWRCWWDGGTTGPITTRWGVSSFPTIFVLDRAGVIRFRDVRGDDLEKAVVSLLDEFPAETPSQR
jgi:thiol-disulfide isomerase/thioredoxin